MSLLSLGLCPLLSAEEAKVKAEEAPPAKAEPNLPPRRAVWILGTDVHRLKIDTDNEIYKVDAYSPDINAGYGVIRERTWLLTRAHLVLGPTSQRFPDSPPLDFSGYGVSFAFGLNLSGSKLRSPGGDYGIEAGIENFELVGRSFRRQNLDDGSYTNSWILKTRWTGVSGALTAAFLKPSRPAGNRPEWLMTRVEGYRLSLGVVLPVQSSWDLRFERNAEGRGDRGKWKGLLALFSLSAFLGV